MGPAFSSLSDYGSQFHCSSLQWPDWAELCRPGLGPGVWSSQTQPRVQSSKGHPVVGASFLWQSGNAWIYSVPNNSNWMPGWWWWVIKTVYFSQISSCLCNFVVMLVRMRSREAAQTPDCLDQAPALSSPPPRAAWPSPQQHWAGSLIIFKTFSTITKCWF